MSSREEFERELEQYIAQRNKGSFSLQKLLKGLKPQKKMPEEVQLPSEAEEYKEEEPTPEEQSEQPTEEPAPEEPVPDKKGAVTRLLEKIGLVSKEEPEEEGVKELIEQDETKDDLKEVAKITLAIIKQLPEEQLKAFKNSPDFERMKTIFRKHGLIK